MDLRAGGEFGSRALGIQHALKAVTSILRAPHLNSGSSLSLSGSPCFSCPLLVPHFSLATQGAHAIDLSPLKILWSLITIYVSSEPFLAGLSIVKMTNKSLAKILGADNDLVSYPTFKSCNGLMHEILWGRSEWSFNTYQILPSKKGAECSGQIMGSEILQNWIWVLARLLVWPCPDYPISVRLGFLIWEMGLKIIKTK